MNTITELIRSTLSERGVKNPGTVVSRVIGRKLNATSNKFCDRAQFSLIELAKLDREFDFPAEALKEAIHNYKWGEDLNGDKPK